MNRAVWISMTVALAATSALAEGDSGKAKTEGSGAQPLSAASDADNYQGDKVSFPMDQKVKVLTIGGAKKDHESGCLRAGTVVQGLGNAAVPTADGNGAEQRVLFVVTEVPGEKGGTPAPASDSCGKPVGEGTVVALAPDTFSLYHGRAGWTYGTLVVPYKYQFRGDRSVTGGATLGGYVGRRFLISGLSNQWIVFAGLTKVDVPSEKDGQTTTEQLAGLSYGVGLLTTVKQAFQLGVVVGADRVSKSAEYVNNGKPWISLSIGFDFSN